MFIKSAKLKNFKPFSLSNIQQLHLNSSSDIQIFIGDNGSGKSSLLNELHPNAAIKPMYNKKGLKEIVLTHKNDEYILTSDFASVAGNHSFRINDEELNISGTAGIQNELVSSYLGYTPLIHDITHMNYLMCSMSKTERKNFLLELNPVDLSLVLDKHKILCSRLREFKNNLTLLHNKKLEVETHLLSKDLRKSLMQEKTKLSEVFNGINSELYHLNKVFDSIGKDLDKYPLHITQFKLSDVHKTCHQINQFLTECQDIVDREESNLRSTYTDGFVRTTVLENDLTYVKEKISNIVRELETYDKHIQTIGTDVTLESLQKEVITLKKQKYDIDPKVRIIPEHDYEYQRTILLESIDYLHSYRERFRNRVPNEKHLELVFRKKYILQTRLSSTSANLSTVEKNISEWNDQLRTIPQRQNSFEMSQMCDSCEYYNHFESQLVEIRDKLKISENLRQHYSNQVHKLTKIVDILDNLYADMAEQHETFVAIVKSLRYTVFNMEYSALRHVYLSDFNQLIGQMQLTLTESLRSYENNILDKHIEEVSSRISYMLSTGTQSIDILKDLSQKKHTEYLETQDRLLTIESQYVEVLQKTKKYKEFLDKKKDLEQMESDLNSYTEYVVLRANRKFCLTLIEEQKVELNSVNQKLREIETTIQDQISLQARLDDVVTTIATIEKQRKELQIIEYGLSPYTGFLNQNLVDFTNVLIHNVNCILSQVWSYPLQLVPLDLTNPFDGIFPILVDDIVVPDISKLSKGQQAIVNLAWTFAFIFAKKLSDYPVYLDEVDGALDPFHKQKLLEWLQSAIEKKYVSQMWLVGHDLVLFNGFNNAEILALMDNNIVQCEKINEHVRFD